MRVLNYVDFLKLCNNQKGIGHFVIIFLLVIGFLATFYLVNYTQTNLRSKAHEGAPILITDKQGNKINSTNTQDVYLKISLPDGWYLADSYPEETSTPIDIDQPYSSSDSSTIKQYMLQQITISNNDLPDTEDSHNFAFFEGDSMKYVLSNSLNWKLEALAPTQNSAVKIVKVNFFDGISSVSFDAKVVLKRTATFGDIEKNNTFLITAFVDESFSNPKEIEGWLEDAINIQANQVFENSGIRKKVELDSVIVQKIEQNCQTAPLVFQQNRIALFVSNQYDVSWAQPYTGQICFKDNRLNQEAVGTLIHEIGHIFGLPDFYLQDVKSYNNFVVPIDIISSVQDLMWNDYIDNPYFSPLSVKLANSIDSYPADIWNYWRTFTPNIIALQITENNLPLVGAKVEVFPQVYSMTEGQLRPFIYIPNIASLEQVTDNTGRVFLGNEQNLFNHHKISSAMPGTAVLLRITKDNKERFAAFTLSDIASDYTLQNQIGIITKNLAFEQLQKRPEQGQYKVLYGFDKTLDVYPLNDDQSARLEKHVKRELQVINENR